MAPSRLRALRLLSAPPYQPQGAPPALSDWLTGTHHFIKVVERAHSSDVELLDALHSEEEDWVVDADHRAPGLVLRGLLPPLVADSYLRNQLGQALTADHMAALLDWCGGWRVPAQQFAGLAGRVRVATVRESLKHAMVASCQAQHALTSGCVVDSVACSRL